MFLYLKGTVWSKSYIFGIVPNIRIRHPPQEETFRTAAAAVSRIFCITALEVTVFLLFIRNSIRFRRLITSAMICQFKDIRQLGTQLCFNPICCGIITTQHVKLQCCIIIQIIFIRWLCRCKLFKNKVCVLVPVRTFVRSICYTS